MHIPELFLAYVFGTIIGSFLNVVVFRYNSGFSILGRSHCLSCGTTLSWKELIPVASFIIQRGRCATCSTRISRQYAAVELATGAIFSAVVWKYLQAGSLLSVQFALVPLVIDLAIWCLLVTIFVYDSRHTVIPDAFVWSFSIAALLRSILAVSAASFSALSMALFAGPILGVPFLLLWLFSKGTWIGLGDAKLALGIGWFLGLSGGISAVLIGVWAGALWSLVIIGLQRLFEKKTTLFGKKLTGKTEIPFAPFLIFGIAAVYFLEWNVISF